MEMASRRQSAQEQQGTMKEATLPWERGTPTSGSDPRALSALRMWFRT